MRFPPFNPYIVVVIGVLSISSSAIFVKLANQAPAGIIAFYRLLFAIILLAPYVFLKHRHEFKLIRQRDWIFSIYAGFFLAAHFILWFESLNYTSVASSVALVSMQPIFVFLGTYLFFKAQFSPGAIISMFIALLGSFIISWGDYQLSDMNLLGNVLAILGTISVAAYVLFGQKIRSRLSLMTYTLIVYSISAVILSFYNVIVQNPFTGFPVNHWWILLSLAIIPTFFGHALFNWSLKWLSASTISMTAVFQTIVASILAYVILQEHITYSQWLGGTIVLIGLFLFIMSTARKRKVTISYIDK